MPLNALTSARPSHLQTLHRLSGSPATLHDDSAASGSDRVIPHDRTCPEHPFFPSQAPPRPYRQSGAHGHVGPFLLSRTSQPNAPLARLRCRPRRLHHEASVRAHRSLRQTHLDRVRHEDPPVQTMCRFAYAPSVHLLPVFVTAQPNGLALDAERDGSSREHSCPRRGSRPVSAHAVFVLHRDVPAL